METAYVISVLSVFFLTMFSHPIVNFHFIIHMTFQQFSTSLLPLAKAVFASSSVFLISGLILNTFGLDFSDLLSANTIHWPASNSTFDLSVRTTFGSRMCLALLVAVAPSILNRTTDTRLHFWGLIFWSLHGIMNRLLMSWRYCSKAVVTPFTFAWGSKLVTMLWGPSHFWAITTIIALLIMFVHFFLSSLVKLKLLDQHNNIRRNEREITFLFLYFIYRLLPIPEFVTIPIPKLVTIPIPKFLTIEQLSTGIILGIIVIQFTPMLTWRADLWQDFRTKYVRNDYALKFICYDSAMMGRQVMEANLLPFQIIAHLISFKSLHKITGAIFVDLLYSLLPMCAITTFGEALCGLSFRTLLRPSGQMKTDKVEYVFVDFNAWEYCASDELWAGMIRAMYQKVEKRMEYNQGEYLKLLWRVKRAVELLEEGFGGKERLRALFIAFAIAVSVLIWCLVAYICNPVKIKLFDFTEYQISVITTIFSAVYYVWWTGNTIFQFAEVDRGDFIFSQAITVKDKIGFMASVRKELTELFNFINNDFKDVTGTQLRLVLFIDDLDRCLGGRNVKMLEAIQLLLNVPGAPVFIFLAIDSRVVVASIEQHLNKSLKLEDAIITGWEYLEKIVQIPFCIPEISPEKTTRFVSSIVKKNVKPATIVAIIRAIKNHHRFLKNKYEANEEKEKFDLWCELPITVVEGKNIGGVILPAKKFIEDLSNIDERNAILKLQLLSDNLNISQNNDGVHGKYFDSEREETLCQQAEALLNRCTFFYAKTVKESSRAFQHDTTATQQGENPNQYHEQENEKQKQKSSKIGFSVANFPEKKLDDCVNRKYSAIISQMKQIPRNLEALPRKGLDDLMPSLIS